MGASIYLEHTSGRQIVIGDVHGCLDTLQTLIEEKLHLHSEDQLIFLGDIISRGPQSKGVLDYLLALQLEYDVTCIKGNHEHNFLTAYDCGLSFFEDFLATYDAEDIMGGNLYAYLDFCAQMPYYVETPTHLFSHMGFYETAPLSYNDTRAFFHGQSIAVDLGAIQSKKQVHGHICQPLNKILAAVTDEKKVIGIDGGCCFKEEDGLGYLCALDVYGNELFVQRNKEKVIQ